MDNRYRSALTSPDFQDEFGVVHHPFHETYWNEFEIGFRPKKPLEHSLYLAVDAGSPPKIVEEGYRRFNIILFDLNYYGLAQDEGAFDIEKIKQGSYDHVVNGESVEDVKRQIDNLLDNRKNHN